MSKAIVLYNSKGGNTRQVAMQIAEGLEADIGENKKVPDLDDYDLIVVGSWMIMGMVSSAGKRILKRVSRKVKTNKKVALFFTSGAPDNFHPSTENTPNPRTIHEVMFEKMENILSNNKSITILAERFYCKGAVRMLKKIVSDEGHPTAEKLAEAKAFGKQLTNQI